MKRYTFLIAEDEIEELSYLTNYIEKNYEDKIAKIITASNGQDALEKTQEVLPDVALLDIAMPKVNGLEVASRLKKKNPAIKVIMITAYDSFSFARESIKIGVKDYLLKPYLDDELKKTLDSTLDEIDLMSQKSVSEILSIISKDQEPVEHPITRLVNSYINDHYSEKISLEIMSFDLGFSSSYISKCLKKYMNTGFPELLMTKRCNMAAKLLIETKLNISEIAYKVGFSDPNYFYKCFKAQFGIQPKKYAFVLQGRNTSK